MDGSSSCVLEGYGAYGMSYSPRFSVLHSVALHGVVMAYAHTRGGSEKGEAWYKAATRPPSEHLERFHLLRGIPREEGYTSPAHLAGTGTSAGAS